MAQIHPTALVDPAARLHDTVQVGPYCVIGAEVSVGADTVFGPHCVVQGRTTIGEANHFHAYGAIGGQPQDMSHGGEITELRIGDRNTVREFCTFNTGTHKEQGITQVGSDNWIMAYVHVAHDVVVGDHCVLANNATLAGHVRVGDWAVIGGLTGVHQFVHIGAHSMIGFQAHVAQDVPPFMTVDGNPLAVRAVNLTGLRRRDFSDARISAIRQMHRLIYRSGLTLDESKSRLEALSAEHPEAAADTAVMLDFLATARRGIVR